MYDGPVSCSVGSSAGYKSRGEKTIGDFLADSQIRFTYERPTLVIDKGQPKLWYPDFTLDEYKVLIDYAGVKDDRRTIIRHSTSRRFMIEIAWIIWCSHRSI